jgi:hypothetical protein
MVAYETIFEEKSILHLMERKLADLEAMFNDVEDIASNMRSYMIQLKTRQDFLEILYSLIGGE